jgi:hypothetical protein
MQLNAEILRMLGFARIDPAHRRSRPRDVRCASGACGHGVMTKPETDGALLSRGSAIGLLAGLAIFAAVLALPPPAGLPVAGWHTLGLALFMAVWWTTEPVPIGVTALLPLIVLPLLGVADIAAAAAPYANPLVFLFLGGFLLAACVKRWGLHRRIAYGVVVRVGTDPRRLILGFMLASGFLSMWISNTAAVILLLPVAMSVIAAVENAIGTNGQTRRFALALLLGLAYAASIGGMGTLIGTPPNALLAGYLNERHGIDLSFAAWSAMAVPLAAIFLPLAWLLLTRMVFPIGRDMIEPSAPAICWRHRFAGSDDSRRKAGRHRISGCRLPVDDAPAAEPVARTCRPHRSRHCAHLRGGTLLDPGRRSERAPFPDDLARGAGHSLAGSDPVRRRPVACGGDGLKRSCAMDRRRTRRPRRPVALRVSRDRHRYRGRAHGAFQQYGDDRGTPSRGGDASPPVRTWTF